MLEHTYRASYRAFYRASYRAFISILSFIICIFAECHAQQTIGIYTNGFIFDKSWDPDSVKTGIYGSEEAVIYLSNELAKLGYRVLVFADPPDNSPYISKGSNPQYIHSMFYIFHKCDIAIAWRNPGIATTLKGRSQQLYLWPHDSWHNPIHEDYIHIFDGVFWVSKWQRNQWISVNPAFEKFNNIYGNGIKTEDFDEIKERENPYSCIYGSSYDRGLEHLLSIWPDIKKQFPRATLDIYYGFTNSKFMDSLEFHKKMESLADLDVKEHGKVSHEELNKAYAHASFWTYPCTYPETFCITALRAQLSGAIPVIIDGTGLSETVRHGYKCNTQAQYLGTLIEAMQNAEKISLEKRQQMGEFILKEYTWKHIAEQWHKTFQNKTDAKSLEKE